MRHQKTKFPSSIFGVQVSTQLALEALSCQSRRRLALRILRISRERKNLVGVCRPFLRVRSPFVFLSTTHSGILVSRGVAVTFQCPEGSFQARTSDIHNYSSLIVIRFVPMIHMKSSYRMTQSLDSNRHRE